jgi:hypothetical protein
MVAGYRSCGWDGCPTLPPEGTEGYCKDGRPENEEELRQPLPCHRAEDRKRRDEWITIGIIALFPALGIAVWLTKDLAVAAVVLVLPFTVAGALDSLQGEAQMLSEARESTDQGPPSQERQRVGAQ